MAMNLTDFGGSYILDLIFGGNVATVVPDSFIVRLYTNTAGSLDDATILGDIVEPVSAGSPVCGYAEINFDAGEISAASLSAPGDVPYVTITPGVWTGGGNVGNQTGALVWKFTGATSLPITGYDIIAVMGVDQLQLWWEDLPSAYQPTSPGDELRLTPKFMLGKATSGDLATITA